jgi:hypothetical protein
MSTTRGSTVLTLRVPPELDRRIEQEARRRRRTKSAILRDVLEVAFAGRAAADPIREARRQSLLVSGRASEREALRFLENAPDVRGWK